MAAASELLPFEQAVDTMAANTAAAPRWQLCAPPRSGCHGSLVRCVRGHTPRLTLQRARLAAPSGLDDGCVADGSAMVILRLVQNAQLSSLLAEVNRDVLAVCPFWDAAQQSWRPCPPLPALESSASPFVTGTAPGDQPYACLRCVPSTLAVRSALMDAVPGQPCDVTLQLRGIIVYADRLVPEWRLRNIVPSPPRFRGDHDDSQEEVDEIIVEEDVSLTEEQEAAADDMDAELVAAEALLPGARAALDDLSEAAARLRATLRKDRSVKTVCRVYDEWTAATTALAKISEQVTSAGLSTQRASSV